MASAIFSVLHQPKRERDHGFVSHKLHKLEYKSSEKNTIMSFHNNLSQSRRESNFLKKPSEYICCTFVMSEMLNICPTFEVGITFGKLQTFVLTLHVKENEENRIY